MLARSPYFGSDRWNSKLLDREVLQPPWVRPRWLDVSGAGERLDKLRAGVSVIDLYEGDVSG
jgi:hypothetical protein